MRPRNRALRNVPAPEQGWRGDTLSFCHPRRLSPTPVPDLIGDPVKKWIQSSKGSSVVVFGICSGAISWRFLSSPSVILDACPRRLSPT